MHLVDFNLESPNQAQYLPSVQALDPGAVIIRL